LDAIAHEEKLFKDFDHSSLKPFDNPLKLNSIFDNNVAINKTTVNILRSKQPSMGVSAYSLKIKRNRLTSEENNERVVQRRYDYWDF
jgi:hypothetical protein